MPQLQPSKTSHSKSYPLQVANPHQVLSMALAKKLEEVKNDRTLMDENAKKRRERKVTKNWKPCSGLTIQSATRNTRTSVIANERCDS